MRTTKSPAAFEADLDPRTGAPRMRFNFHNGWTGSLALGMMASNRCDAVIASVAAWPTGQVDAGLTELGPTEASADEAMNWLDDICCREARP